MSLKPKANCYGFSIGCRKLSFFSVVCCTPQNVGKHCPSHCNTVVSSSKRFLSYTVTEIYEL